MQSQYEDWVYTVEQIRDGFINDRRLELIREEEDPKLVWEQSMIEANSAVEAIADLEQEVSVSWGKIPAKEYLNQLILDRLIHGWDLAKATKQNTDLDPELVKYVWDYAAPRTEELSGSGAFGERVEVKEDASLQTKLLALLGRRVEAGI